MSLIKKYAIRPKVLEKYCLADFAAWIDVTTEKSRDCDYESDNNDDDPNAADIQEDTTASSNNCYTVGALTFKKRNKAKIIRYVRFNKENDSEKYYREQLMLFCPWRSENDILGLCDTYQEQYFTVE